MKNQDPKNATVMPVCVDEWRKQAISRSNCYGLLALVFRDTPTTEVVTQLRVLPLAETLKRLGYDVAQDIAGELEAVTERLGEQYTQTFVGPGPHVSPYASVHHGDEGQLWGDSTVWVKQFIEMTGLSFKSNWGSIPDHIAIELELMQRLTTYEAELWIQIASAPLNDKEILDKRLYQCLQAQEDFLREHLCEWVPRFCGCVLETSTSLFYRKMARLTKLVVLSDVEQVTAARNALRCNSFGKSGQCDGP